MKKIINGEYYENKFLSLAKIKDKDKRNKLIKKLFDNYPEYKVSCLIDSVFKEFISDKEILSRFVMYAITLIDPNNNLTLDDIKDRVVDKTNLPLKANLLSRGCIADKLVMVDNYIILFECNYNKSSLSKSKNNYTFHSSIVSTITNGDKPENYKAVLLNFDNFDVYKRDEYIYFSNTREEKYNFLEDKNTKIIHFNLAKYRNTLYNTNINALMRSSDTDKILYYMVMNEKTKANDYAKEVDFMIGVNENISAFVSDENAILENSQKLFFKIAKEEGYDDGHKKGLIKGRDIGLIDVALKMINSGYEDKEILLCTELPLQKIIELRNNMNTNHLVKSK